VTLAAVAGALAATLGGPLVPAGRTGGGSIHGGHRFQARGGSVFVKVAAAADAPMLAAEAEGLAALAAAGAIRVPSVLDRGLAGEHAYLALEWLELRAPDAESEAALGAALAALHRHTAPRFGYPSDNFLGRTPQPNGWCEDPVEFLARRRLGPQLERAAQNGYRLAEQGARLLEALPAFYRGYRPVASLLHGDLWGGNHASLADGTPVVYDPAVHYGDREAELAMTRLFGGFRAEFQRAYEDFWPMDAGARAREDLHALYHVLNHLNLFGAGYAPDALARIERLLGQLR
jgi:fructosamine-3-kinase